MAKNTLGESELAKKVRYGVGLIRSSAEDFPHDPRAQIQLKVCEDVELVLAELEARIEQLERIGKHLLKEYEKEEEEYGFPFNFALRAAHRELSKALEEV